jgi:glycosyltransferase involved in cell wall biosynthesis
MWFIFDSKASKKTLMKTKNILILTYWSYKDPLIQTYTLPYVRIISKYLPVNSTIYLVTFEQMHLRLSELEQIKAQQDLAQYNVTWKQFDYSGLGLRLVFNMFIFFSKLLFLIFSKKIAYIHTWAMSAGGMGYILSILTRTPLILDSYEPHAEACIENGSWKKNSTAFKILSFFEKKQTQRATHFIAAAKSMRQYAIEKYGVTPLSIFVKPACVDLEKFTIPPIKNQELLVDLGLKNKIVCVYAGKFGAIYLDQEVFDFFKTAHDYWGDTFRVLLLTNESEESLRNYCNNSCLDFNIFVVRFVPHAEVARFMSLGDFGITPVRSVPTKQHCTPIKDGEYWALGLPVVITPHISDDSDIIEKNDIGAIWSYKDKASYINTIKKIDTLLHSNDPQALKLKIRDIAEQYRSFEIAENIYKKIYSTV